MIKGFIFDIDDTLLYRKLHKTPASALKALRELKKKGYKLAVCTAREKAKLKTVPHELMECVDFVAAGNGSVSYMDFKLYNVSLIDPDDLSKYCDYINENNLTYSFSVESGAAYFWGDYGQETIRNILNWFGRMPKMKKMEKTDKVVSFNVRTDDEKTFKDLEAINPNVKPINYHNSAFFCAGNVDKISGIESFCQAFDFTKDELCSFGDGLFDASMIEYAKIGVAMKDSPLAETKVADYETDKSLIDGGIYEFLVRKGYIDRDIPEIKIFFFDIDSTSYDHSIWDVRDSTVNALKKLREKGIKTCICTSRSFDEMRELPRRLLDNMDGYITCAGAMTNFGNIKIARVIDKDQAERAIKLLEEYDLTYRYVLTDGIGYFNREDPQEAKLYEKLYFMAPGVKKYEGEDIVHILYHTSEPKIINRIHSEVYGCEHLNFGFSQEILAKGTDKSEDMFRLVDTLGIDRDKVGAFGDGINDVDMIKRARLGIAMGNGKDEAKIVSDYVTEDISDEGLYKALVKYGYIDED